MTVPRSQHPGATGQGIVATQYGIFNVNPGPNELPIPRNYGRGPSQFSVNVRMSRTWGFGERASAGSDNGMGGNDRGPRGDRGGRGGGGGGMRGGPMMMGGGGMRGGGGGACLAAAPRPASATT